jgi:subtilisin family serine protease
MIHAAGNDGADNDITPHFPLPDLKDGQGKVESWIEVGASSWQGFSNLAASFSNYGQEDVDVFAPGVSIYSTVPDDAYDRADGTSMASPVVSGLAALIMAYYPEFTASDVKEILLTSAVSYSDKEVLLPGSEDTMVLFGSLSRSGAIVNAMEALKLAEMRSKM